MLAGANAGARAKVRVPKMVPNASKVAYKDPKVMFNVQVLARIPSRPRCRCIGAESDSIPRTPVPPRAMPLEQVLGPWLLLVTIESKIKRCSLLPQSISYGPHVVAAAAAGARRRGSGSGTDTPPAEPYVLTVSGGMSGGARTSLPYAHDARTFSTKAQPLLIIFMLCGMLDPL